MSEIEALAQLYASFLEEPIPDEVNKNFAAVYGYLRQN